MQSKLAAATAIALLALASPAQAETAKAGPFVQEGIEAMWAIGLELPFEADAHIEIRSCDVRRRTATCRLTIAVEGYRPCSVTVRLSRKRHSFPARGWHCPEYWTPQKQLTRPSAASFSERLALKAVAQD